MMILINNLRGEGRPGLNHLTWIKKLPITLVLIISCMACNKTSIWNVTYPCEIELLVGQRCTSTIVLNEYEYSGGLIPDNNNSSSTSISNGTTISSYSNHTQLPTQTFSGWESSHPDVVCVENDTLIALSSGYSWINTICTDHEGNVWWHECKVHVTNRESYTAQLDEADTVFVTEGTVQMGFLEFDALFPLDMEIEDTTYCNLLFFNPNLKIEDDQSIIRYNTLVFKAFTYWHHYCLGLNALHEGTTTLRIHNDTANIYISVPIVVRKSMNNEF